MTAPEIGVLLPVRLELRFVAPGALDDGVTDWRLRIRIVPDAISVIDHDPVPSELELDAVETMWQRAGSDDLDSPSGRRAWEGLIAAVGLERAAWLARTFRPEVGPDGGLTITRPTTVRDEARRSRLAGLPPTIELWMGRGGSAPTKAVETTVLVDELPLDFADPEEDRGEWWTSLEEAVRVGLAAEIELGPARPVDIDVVYAVGIGGGDPGPLLAAHGDSGRLGMLAPGTATTSIDGEELAGLGGDVDDWRALVATPVASQAGTVAVLASTIGPVAAAGPATMAAVPGGEADHRPLNRALVATLWPALWGHSLADVNGFGAADRLGVWAADNVVPEGPLPALRIGDRPYGLLPVTSLARWQRASRDPTIERELVPVVGQLVERWARAAEPSTTPRPPPLIDHLVATPNASTYSWRWMVPLELAAGVSFRFGATMAATEATRWWHETAGDGPRLPSQPGSPHRRLVGVGDRHRIAGGLVSGGAEGMPAFDAIRRAPVDDLLDRKGRDDRYRERPLDDSLLTELARHSVIAASAAVARTAERQPRAIVEPLAADPRRPTELEGWARRLRPEDLARQRGPASTVYRNLASGLEVLGQQEPSKVERALLAALDTATHRIDPWATAVAWRRLGSMGAATRSLGLYGWVDRPRPRSSEGVDEHLLAPSVEQATVAALLRDRARRDPDADRWQMDLTSEAVRRAVAVADEVRDGSHPAEVLGRLVERIVARPRTIDGLRSSFPLISGGGLFLFPLRRVCDGTAVLAAAVDEPGRLRDLGVTDDELVQLAGAAEGVDALGDLHVAEAAYGMVRSRPADTRAATAAAAALGRPPRLDVLRTPRSGRTATTVAVAVLPAVPTDPSDDPVALADGSVAAFLDAVAGDPAGADWTWTTTAADGATGQPVTLAEAGLRPSDTVGLGAGNLAQVIADVTGLAGIEPATVPGHDLLRAVAAAIGGGPALATDLADAGTNDDGPVVAELVTRYRALRQAALDAAAGLTTAGQSIDEVTLRAALATAARWGITPQAELGAGVDGPAGDDVANLAVRVDRAAQVLAARVAAGPDEVAAAELGVAELGEALAGLAAPEGTLPISARVPARAVQDLAPVGVGAADGTSDDGRAWLETVAPVRPPLARVEAMQLEREAAGQALLAMWTSRPDDIWQTVDVVDDDGIAEPSRLVMAVAPDGTLPATDTELAAVVLDRFVEVIPETEQVAGLAFQHDLPSSRAPQAVLLAVPPVVDEDLTTPVLIDIVAEARRLTRARMADPDELGSAVNSLHLAAISASGRTGVEVGG